MKVSKKSLIHMAADKLGQEASLFKSMKSFKQRFI